MSLPRYPKYKSSGVEWLGEVPGHWKVKRLKQACHVFPSNVDKKSYDDETPVNLCNYTDVYYNETITADMEFMAATATDDQIAKFTLRAGDTIITKDSETADDIAIGAYVPADMPGVICGYHLSMIRPMTDTNGAFVKRLFDSTYVRSCVAVRANGLTRVGLGQYEIDNLELPFPPLDEQQTIAAFLDRETGKIDALIAEQRRLVELLAEKRQAVISHAVTKGLNPNVRMKDSGIEWLGEVPEHWATPSLYMRYSSELGKMLDSSKITGDHLIPYVRNVDVQWGSINLDDLPLMDIREDEHQRYTVKAGDLLICEGGEVGRAAIVPAMDAVFGYQKAIHRLRALNDDEDTKFMYFTFLWVANTGVFNLSGSSTIAHLTGEQLRRYRFPKPPVDEQVAISVFLDTEAAKFDTLTAEANRAIELLQERRSALISAAVAGKIDVRSHFSKLETA